MGPTSTVCTCTKPALVGRSYCEDHLGIVYQKGTALRKRHKDIRRANDIRTWESLFNDAVEELESEGFFETDSFVDIG